MCGTCTDLIVPFSVCRRSSITTSWRRRGGGCRKCWWRKRIRWKQNYHLWSHWHSQWSCQPKARLC